MQIKVENVYYKKYKNLNFEIEDNKITGLVCNDIFILENINKMLKNNDIKKGTITYSNKNKIGIISGSYINNMLEGTVLDYLGVSAVDTKKLQMFDLEKEILNQSIESLSSTEKIKILFLDCILKDCDTILIDGILEELDDYTKEKILKLILRLKKFKNKTIVVGTIDIDSIYEYIDNLIIINNDKCIFSNNKYSIFEENKNIIYRPFVIKIKEMIYKKSNIDLGNNDSINELIKAIYREIR